MNRRYVRICAVVGVVWAIILVLGAILDRNVRFSGTTFVVVLLVFGGFVIGWVLGAIARTRSNSPPSA